MLLNNSFRNLGDNHQKYIFKMNSEKSEITFDLFPNEPEIVQKQPLTTINNYLAAINYQS